MKRLLGVFIILFATFSCGNGFDPKAEEKKVLDIHDEVMPKIGEVMNLRKKVLALATELESKDSSDANIDSLRDMALDLDNARKGMMQWMNDWSKNAKVHVNGQSTVDEQKAFFASEMERVTKVKDDINNSIAAAKEVLN